jgi:DNA-binding CsgD family transcriptional regulator
VIRLAVVAPTPALRAGLRALLDTSSTPGAARMRFEDNSTPSAVILDEAALHSLPGLDVRVDVIVWVVENNDRRDFDPAWLEKAAVLFLIPEDAGGAGSLSELLRFVDASQHVWGALSMDASAEELHAAVQALNQGMIAASPALLGSLLSQPLLQQGEIDPLAEHLTGRESEVLQLLARGLANKQIAAALEISEHTVKFHISAIFAKLGAASRTEAVRIGVRRGLVAL